MSAIKRLIDKYESIHMANETGQFIGPKETMDLISEARKEYKKLTEEED